MNLSVDLFDDIVACLNRPTPENAGDGAGADGTPAGVPQRRRNPRTGVEARVALIPLTDRLGASAITVPVRDLSPAGIGFLHATKIDLDEPFVVMLPLRDGGQIALLCAVAYWQPLAAGVFAIGARFTRVLRQGGASDAEHKP